MELSESRTVPVQYTHNSTGTGSLFLLFCCCVSLLIHFNHTLLLASHYVVLLAGARNLEYPRIFLKSDDGLLRFLHLLCTDLIRRSDPKPGHCRVIEYMRPIQYIANDEKTMEPIDEYLLEESWTEDGGADDILLYAEERSKQVTVLKDDDIMQHDSQNLLSYICCFCDTEIIQHHLTKLFPKKVVETILPDTYESLYHPLYGREVIQMSFGEFMSQQRASESKPRFLKPVGNDKSFEGRVICDESDFHDRGIPVPADSTVVYTCEPVQFLSEVRLLVGNERVYGVGLMRGRPIADTFLDDHADFIQQIVRKTGPRFRCIDIGLMIPGMMKDAVFAVSAQWSIVEVNPPFSLDDHGIDIDSYMQFCSDAFAWIREF